MQAKAWRFDLSPRFLLMLRKVRSRK